MLGLVSFPFLVEPNLASTTQAYSWSGAYAGFALLCVVTAWVSLREPAVVPAMEPAAEPAAQIIETAPRPTFGQMSLWVALAACASTLLVSTTTHLSQNVAPIPLLWVVPLALYLITFILCFESDKLYQRWIILPWLAPALAWMAYGVYANEGNLHIKVTIPVFAAGLLIACMMCHGELALRKPAPQYLTLFYMMVSLGGALGGTVVALVAPRVFPSYLELQLALVWCGVMAAIVLWNEAMPKVGVWPTRVLMIIAVGALAGYLGRKEVQDLKGYRLTVRNFYGALKVRDDDVGTEFGERVLLHGTINHGNQLLTPEKRYITTSYYSENSGLGRAIRALQERGPVRIGSIGLGAGVTTNYGRQGDYLRVYEINPLVEKIAQTEFTFFPHSAADKKIMMGDARLVLESQQSQQFDILAVDAFSSDSIPVHLLTREAFALYFRQLKPNGVLALHISNRYLDLAPVCAAGAKAFDKKATVVADDGEGGSYLNSSTWVLVTSDTSLTDAPSFMGANMYPPNLPEKFRPWTDDYSNIWQILSLN
jgi:hypothetical protein